jgi:2-iminobutanoate/2-iminopropanoate deaminase
MSQDGPDAAVRFGQYARTDPRAPEAFAAYHGALDRDSIHSRKEANMNSMAYSRTFIGVAALAGLVALSAAAESKEYLKGERPQQRGYSEAVITEGGRTVWLAGQTATVDDNGKSLAADFEGQVRQLFKNLDRTLKKTGGNLSDMVQMTVFITDVRYGDRMTQIRREIFGDNFPGSALITITALAVPDAKIEIQGYAVIGAK